MVGSDFLEQMTGAISIRAKGVAVEENVETVPSRSPEAIGR